MELRHLRHFLAVAEELHMGRAAERLGMAQPPLSQSIARLERDLGVRLFERANRRLSLSRAGAALVEEAREAVRHADRGAALARGAAAGEAGELRVGFVSAAAYEHLPGFLRRLRRDRPAVRPALLELSTNQQVAALADGDLDLGFVHPPLGGHRGLELQALPSEPLVAALPEDGDIGGAEVTLAELAALGLVLFPQAQGPTLHARILDAFASAGLEVCIVQEATRALTLLSLVSAGLGATLLPRSTRRLAFRGVRFAAIADAALPAVPLAVAARRRPRPPVVDSALKLLPD